MRIGRAFFAVSAVFSVAYAIVACSDSTETMDGGADAAPKMDSSMMGTDTGTQDTGAQDTGTDTGTQDTGTQDSGTTDGGPSTFMVVRVGVVDGGALSTAAAAVAIEERNLSNGNLAKTINLPTAVMGMNQPVTLRGNTTTEGTLTRAGNGNFVVMGGYAATPGTANVASTASMQTNRVIARIDKAGNVDSTTRLNAAFDTVSIRGAATNDGMTLWASGENGSSMSGGVYTVNLGQTGGTRILDAPQNMRAVAVFGGQLYGSTQSGANGNMLRVFSIGNGLPTMGGQTGTQLPGMPQRDAHGFALVDTDSTAGVDTAYVCDTASLNATGGLYKYKLTNNMWTQAAVFKGGLTGAPLNVAAWKSGNNVDLYVVTLDNPAKLVKFVDDNMNMNPMATTISTAPTDTQYRGVAISPNP